MRIDVNISHNLNSNSRQVFEMETKREAIDLPICMHGLYIGDEFGMLTHANLYTS